MRRAILALTFAAFLWFPASAAAAQTPTVVHVWRANLDGDAHIEHVRLMLRIEPNPFGGTGSSQAPIGGCSTTPYGGTPSR